MDHLHLNNDLNIHVGEVIIIKAQVVRCFNKSAEVIVRVLLDSTLSNLSTQSRTETICLAHGFFIFVRLDKQTMPSVFPQTFSETQEYELSMERRRYRQSKKETIENSLNDSSLQSVIYDISGHSVTADQSILQYTYIVLPTHANHMGNTFGGQLLEWAEEIAILSARRHLNSALRSGQALVPVHLNSSFENNSGIILSSLYVHEMSFLAPSTIGDRITCHAQACRTYGSIIEIEVIIRANNVQQNNSRHINTGYFLIWCRNNSKMDLLIPPLRPITFEEKLRYEYSLKRMILVTVRSNNKINQLEVPSRYQEYQSQPSSSMIAASIPLSDMLQIYESSIWNSALSYSPDSSPSPFSTIFNDIDDVLVREYALQDIIGLLCALSCRDQSSIVENDHESRWEMLFSNKSIANENQGYVEMQVCRGFSNETHSKVTKLKITSLLHQELSVVADYLLNFDRRHEWDNILSGEVIKTVIEDHIDIVRMKSSGIISEESGKIGQKIDYCLLRCHRQLDDQRYAIVSRSIIHPSVPPQSGYIRGEVLPSGYLLTPVSSRSNSERKDLTLVQYILQLDAVSAKQFEGTILYFTSPLFMYLVGEMDGTSKAILASMMRLQSLFNS